MPRLNIEELDDAPVFDACGDFAGGQSSNGPPDQLELNQFALALNMDIGRRFAITRRGATQLADAPGATGSRVQGLWWFDKPGTEFLVAYSNGLRKYDETSWTTIAGYTATSETVQLCFAQLVDKLYMVDGTKNLFSFDGTTVSDEGAGGAGDAPAGLQWIVSFTNRLFGAGVAATPDGLYASGFLAGGTWDVAGGTVVGPGMIRIGGGEGDPITGLAPWDDANLVVFKRNSVFLVRAVPTAAMANWEVTQISDTVGCVSHRSIARVGNDIWFLSDSGVRSIGRTIATTQRELDQAISEPVQDLLERVNWDQAAKCSATWWRNRYMLSLPIDAEEEPSTVLVFNTLRQAWSGTWTGWTPLCFVLSKAAGQERLNFGRDDGQVWRWMDYVPPILELEKHYRDGARLGAEDVYPGTAIASELLSRGMIFQEAICSKSGFHLEFEFFGSLAIATLDLVLDEETSATLASSVFTGSALLVLPFDLPALLLVEGTARRAYSLQRFQPFRTLQVRIRSDADRLAVRSVLASAFVNTMEVED